MPKTGGLTLFYLVTTTDSVHSISDAYYLIIELNKAAKPLHYHFRR